MLISRRSVVKGLKGKRLTAHASFATKITSHMSIVHMADLDVDFPATITVFGFALLCYVLLSSHSDSWPVGRRYPEPTIKAYGFFRYGFPVTESQKAIILCKALNKRRQNTRLLGFRYRCQYSSPVSLPIYLFTGTDTNMDMQSLCGQSSVWI